MRLKKAIPSDQKPYAVEFPFAGLDVSLGFGKQPPRQMPDGDYARTCPIGVNVRAYEPSTDRRRGGSRPGLSRYVNAIPGGTAGQIQELACVVGVGYSPPGGTTQSSQGGRVCTLVAVIGGQVYICDAGGSSWTAATNGSSKTVPFNTTGVIRSAVINQRLWLTDGSNCRVWTGSTNTLGDWLATGGTFPKDSTGAIFPKLVTNYRGRCLLSGLSTDPQNIFFSKQADPTDFNYSPSSPSPTQAIAGNLATMGLIGDVVMGMQPFNDDVLVVYGNNDIWAIKGDPMQGGQAQRLVHGIGCVYGSAHCKDPFGTAYFYSNRNAVYAMQPGSQPVRMSSPIDSLLQNVDTGANVIRLLWNEQQQGMHVFITPSSGSAAATHYFWERRSGAWWQDKFANPDHNPTCCVTMDGNTAADRSVLIGSWDGYVRSVNMSATMDDQSPISSSVAIGPVNSPTLDDMVVQEIQAELGESSGDVTCSFQVGRTAEAALSAAARRSFTWKKGLNRTQLVRCAGRAVYFLLSNTSTATKGWQGGGIRMTFAGKGGPRGRN